MNSVTSTFPTDLGISSRVGLTRGIGQLTAPGQDFAQAQIRYREHQAHSSARRRAQVRAAKSARRELAGSGKPVGNARELMSRWTTWFQSAQVRPSSAGSQSSGACRN
jgi:hypothetical protein